MPPGRPRPGRGPIERTDLPDQFTPESIRRLDLGTLRRLSRPGNGVLSDEDQAAFDAALRVVMQGTSARLDQAVRRAGRHGPGTSDPELRRSYERTQQRLAAQARRARRTFPELAGAGQPPPDTSEPTATEEADVAADVEEVDDSDELTLATLESDIEQTSETLEILERIATIEEQQLEHHRSQALRDTRGLFFALLVSVAVIVTGVAPLVEAQRHERRLILLWTLLICGVAGVVYAGVRAAQSKGRQR